MPIRVSGASLRPVKCQIHTSHLQRAEQVGIAESLHIFRGCWRHLNTPVLASGVADLAPSRQAGLLLSAVGASADAGAAADEPEG